MMSQKHFCGRGLAATVTMAVAGLVFEARIKVVGIRGRISEVVGKAPSTDGRWRFRQNTESSSVTD